MSDISMGKRIVLLQLTNRKRSKRERLYVEDNNARHFELIKDLSRFVSSQLSRKKNRKYFWEIRKNSFMK